MGILENIGREAQEACSEEDTKAVGPCCCLDEMKQRDRFSDKTRSEDRLSDEVGQADRTLDKTRQADGSPGEMSHAGCSAEETRHKDRSPDEIRQLTNRLSRIEGQVRGIRAMIENGAYCTDVLVQSAAVTAAMNSFNRVLLENHIRTCVAEDIRDGKDEVIDDLMNILQRLMK